jgi:hypothetical protein
MALSKTASSGRLSARKIRLYWPTPIRLFLSFHSCKIPQKGGLSRLNPADRRMD